MSEARPYKDTIRKRAEELFVKDPELTTSQLAERLGQKADKIRKWKRAWVKKSSSIDSTI